MWTLKVFNCNKSEQLDQLLKEKLHFIKKSKKLANADSEYYDEEDDDDVDTPENNNKKNSIKVSPRGSEISNILKG